MERREWWKMRREMSKQTIIKRVYTERKKTPLINFCLTLSLLMDRVWCLK